MSKPDYSAIDAKILKAIKGGKSHFTDIWRACDSKNVTQDMRTIDKRLQALRKKGLIHYTGHKSTQGWQPKTETAHAAG